MEPAVVSRWKLESQSILLAAAIRVRRLVRARWNREMPLNSQIAQPALCRNSLPDLCFRNDNGRTHTGTRKNAPNLAARRFQSQSQEQSRPESLSGLVC